MVGWTESGDIGFDVLERVHDSLSVSMIMTVRDCMMTCRREDNVGEVMGRNKNNFSFLPVVDEAGCIQGLYRAEQWFNKEAPHQPIGDDFELFSEDLVIGADASILEFVMTADKRPDATRCFRPSGGWFDKSFGPATASCARGAFHSAD